MTYNHREDGEFGEGATMTMQVDKARLDEIPDDEVEAAARAIAGTAYEGIYFTTRTREEYIDAEWRNHSTDARTAITAAATVRSLRSTEGKEGAKTVAYLIDCPVEPCLEFADVDVPDAAIPLVRRSDLAAAEASHKAARENFLTMQGSAAQLLARAVAAEAHVAKLREALEPFRDVADWVEAARKPQHIDDGAETSVRMKWLRAARAALTRSPE